MAQNLDKQPKWVQELVQQMQRERDDAIKAYETLRDTVTESPFYKEVITTKDGKTGFEREYVQASSLHCATSAIDLGIYPEADGDIRLNWNTRWPHGERVEVAVIPNASNALYLTKVRRAIRKHEV